MKKNAFSIRKAQKNSSVFSKGKRSLLVFLLLGICFSLLQTRFIYAKNPKVLKPVISKQNKKVCGIPAKGYAQCHSRVNVDNNGTPLASSIPPTGSYGPVQFHTAYNLPCTPNGNPQSICPQPGNFSNQVIAIVAAYSNPTVENDLNVYSSQYGLPSCTQTNGCLTVVNQYGGTTLPPLNESWAMEISLDVQIAHAICQTCKILLVETNSNYLSDLATGANTAASLGATVISNSYGTSEWSGETSWDSYYNHPGIAVTASSGDSGYGSMYPAASTSVIAVGGTTLNIYTDNTYANESVWNGTGSGCSTYEGVSSWQNTVSNWSQTNCINKRAITDVSAVADPNTGAAIYNSTPYNGQTGWWQLGGTSLASPLIASIYALTGGIPTGMNASSIPYSSFNPENSHDIVNGSNGTCGTIMCNAIVGYDGPSGLGTPNGVSGFISASNSPSSTPTPTIIILSPTPTIGDTTPPTVSITSPTNGSTVARNSNVTITTSANDNIGVTKVLFYVGNTLNCTDTTLPYSCNWRVPGKKVATYTISAVAYDAAGNKASNNIKVTSK